MIPCTRLTISPVAASSCIDLFFCFFFSPTGGGSIKALPTAAAALCDVFYTTFSFFYYWHQKGKGRMFDDNESHRTKTLGGSFHILLALFTKIVLGV
jgi:hypothetical protein